MDYTANPVTFRIVWCRRHRPQARTGLEMEAWRAEEKWPVLISDAKDVKAYNGGSRSEPSRDR